MAVAIVQGPASSGSFVERFCTGWFGFLLRALQKTAIRPDTAALLSLWRSRSGPQDGIISLEMGA